MPARASITINDGAATPVAHIFNPATIVDERNMTLAGYEDRSGGIPVGFPTISLSMKRPSKTSANYRVVAKVVVPTLETISNSTASGILPAPQKAYDSLVTCEFVMNQRMSLQQRKDLLAYAKNLISTSLIQSIVQDFDMPY